MTFMPGVRLSQTASFAASASARRTAFAEPMMRLWQSDLYVEENTLTVNVARLRKKLEEGGLREVIRTKPGRGYIIP